MMEFFTNSLLSQECPKSTMAAKYATNYSYTNCSFSIINFLEASSTAIYKNFNTCAGICGW